MIIAAVVLGIIVGSLPGVVGRGGSIFAAIMVVAGIRMLLRQRVGDWPIPVRMGERSGAAACREPSARAQSSGSSWSSRGRRWLSHRRCPHPRAPLGVTVGTSLVIIALNAAAGIAAHLGDVSLDWPVTFGFSGGAILTSLVSSRAGTSLPDMAMKRAFAVFVLIVAVFVAVSAFVI